jgi:hypothetical protein
LPSGAWHFVAPSDHRPASRDILNPVADNVNKQFWKMAGMFQKSSRKQSRNDAATRSEERSNAPFTHPDRWREAPSATFQQAL